MHNMCAKRENRAHLFRDDTGVCSEKVVVRVCENQRGEERFELERERPSAQPQTALFKILFWPAVPTLGEHQLLKTLFFNLKTDFVASPSYFEM